MLAALFNVPANLGYPLLFALVAGESAGAWIPGETALIVAASLASQGKLSLPIVIGIAAAAAIVGDNVGYQIGRRGLRALANRPARSDRFHRSRRRRCGLLDHARPPSVAAPAAGGAGISLTRSRPSLSISSRSGGCSSGSQPLSRSRRPSRLAVTSRS